MKMQTLLSELRELGVQIQLVNSKLKVSAPAGVLSPAYLEQIRERKTEIIAYLQEINKDVYESIVRVPDQDSYPLSSSQKRLWVLSQLEEQSVTYNIPILYRVRGQLNLGALE